jgi:hypothetical protein
LGRAAADAVGFLHSRFCISHDYDLRLPVARRWEPVVLRRYLSSFRIVEGTRGTAALERRYSERAEAADHRLPVVANATVSRLMVAVYHALRPRWRLRSA